MSNEVRNSKPRKLERRIGPKVLAINSINLTIGAGIFVVPATVASTLGSASFVAYLGCGILISVIMLCFAEMGSRITSSGGAYAYIEALFGPLAGFLTNTLLWFGWAVLADAAILNVMTDMISLWFPIFSEPWFRAIFFFLVMGLFAYVNIIGVEAGARMVVVMTIIKLTPLFLLIVIGLFNLEAENLAIDTFPAMESIGAVSLILFFAFMGTESALNISGEMKNPKKSIPQGIFMGIGGVLIIYLLIQLVATGVMGDELALNPEAPLADTAIKLVGSLGGTVIIATAVISIFSTLGGDVLATSRLPFAAAENNLLPKVLAKIHPKYKTPYMAILLFSGSVFVMAISGGFKTLAILASSSALLVYLGVVLSVIKSRLQKSNADEDYFKIPGGIAVPLLGLVVIGWLLSFMPFNEVIALSIFFAVITIFYFLYRYKRTR